MNMTEAGKVTNTHLTRTAFLYVRQSTLRQRAIALGWPADQVVTIDTDQGQSGASATDRAGFQRLVAEVGMGHAGIVLGLEVSRLARNNADWHRLLEICALTGTLICDEDGVYDPGDFNDRLLLGLKGTMSEAELHFIRARLRGGQLSKARRGELAMALPVGLVYDPTRKVVLDPDTGVQDALRHVFTVFARTGAARATVAEFNTSGLLFPVRVHSGARKGELLWMPLTHSRILHVLHNPRYAGAFAYGRHRQQRTPDGKKTTTVQPREQWFVLIPDAHPGYITLEQFDTNQRTLTDNARAHGADRAAGPAREGPALLQGLAICGRCGNRMTVRYHTRRGHQIPDYHCNRDCIENANQPCQRVPGGTVDAAMGQLLVQTLTPLSLEVALTVQAELQHRADEADALRRNHIERARHRADLARRRYLGVDPDNRLVADTLEADWNDALRALRQAQDDYDQQAKAGGVPALDEQQTARIRQLATDFPALWSNPATPDRERKRMVRLLISDVTMIKTDQIHLHVRLRGGQDTSLTIPIPPNAWQARQTDPATMHLLDQLLNEHTDAETAEQLNLAGHRTGQRQPFTRTIVIQLRQAHQLPSRRERLRAAGMLTVDEMAQRLGVHPSTIKDWRAAGVLNGHKANDKNEHLFPPPDPNDPRLHRHRGRRLANRLHPAPTQGGAV